METTQIIVTGVQVLLALGVLINLQMIIVAQDGKKKRLVEAIRELEGRIAQLQAKLTTERRRHGQAALAVAALKAKAKEIEDRVASEKLIPGPLYYVVADGPSIVGDGLWAVDMTPRTPPTSPLEKARWGNGRQVAVWASNSTEATERALQRHPGGDGYTIGPVYPLGERVLGRIRLHRNEKGHQR